MQLDLHLGFEGTEAGERSPHHNKKFGIEGRHLRLLEYTAADLWWSAWSEKHTALPTLDREEGPSIFWKPIPGQGLLLILGRSPAGTWGRRLQQEMPLKEIQVAMEVGRYYWVMHRGWSHHNSHTLPTSECWQLTNRESPQRGWLFECLMHWTIEKYFREGEHLSTCCAGQ